MKPTSTVYSLRTFGLIVLGFVLALSTGAQEPNRQLIQPNSTNVTPAKRIALVIGNGAYSAAPPLKNPPNDARDMAAALKTLGFDVASGINVGQKDMKRLIREFGMKLKAGGSGLFYYAGHGVQSKGRNYLIPVDANIQSEAEVEDSGVDAALVLNFMDDAQNGLNIVILDACRNNPFARSFRSANDGLAQVDAPTGTLIAYATAPGRVASDGTGNNGLYTSELLKQMQTPGVSITDMFMRVRAEVMKQTGNKQVPWEASSLVGAFYFRGAPGDSAPVTNTTKIDPTAFELSYWDTIKNSASADDFKAYLEKYPNGQFASLAKNRISTLSEAPKSAETKPDDSRNSATELAFWDSVRNSTNPADLRAYLQKYPNGEFAELARNRLAAVSPAVPPADPLAGTTWKGTSSGGDKQYEFQFLPNSEVVWNLKWGRLKDPTFRGTYTRTGNEIHMVFDATKLLGGKEQVAAVLSQDSLTGSWNFGRSEVKPDNGMYKFTVTKTSAPANVQLATNAGLEGTIWKGDSPSGDKHYQVQFLPNGKVVWNLKWNNYGEAQGTWRQDGDTITLDLRPWYIDPVIMTLSGDSISGSWAKGQYKFALTKQSEASAPPSLAGTIWTGDSPGGDKHYEFLFQAGGVVVWNQKMASNVTYEGTWSQNGNTITMNFRGLDDPVLVTLNGNQMAGSWYRGRYKLTLTRTN